jgi:hypothetical protein
MQARIRRKQGVTISAYPPVYDPAEQVEYERHFTPAEIAKQWGSIGLYCPPNVR